jgi:hypothetical protein
MSTPPVLRQKPAPKIDSRDVARPAPAPIAAAAPPVKRPPLVQRLPDMSDAQLLSLQATAIRIAQEPTHPKHNSATTALPLIDAEIGRRTQSLKGRPQDEGKPQ